jgi:hypothetical protein
MLEQPASARSKTALNALIMFAPWEVAKDPQANVLHSGAAQSGNSLAHGA